MSAFIRDIDQLLAQLNLPTDLPVWRQAPFPLKVPVEFVQRMQPGNPEDPLLRQILPVPEEQHVPPGFTTDAVGDLAARATPGLLHKYAGRALIMTSPRCDLHCRFCFRRHFPYEETVGPDRWQQTLGYLRQHEDIHEVILSGGDPLTLSEPELVRRCTQLEALPHLRTLRIHTRTPVVAPSRSPHTGWLSWLRQTRLRTVLVIHCNHPQELSEQTAERLAQYRSTGMQLLNQSVLLKGINDDENTLLELSEALFDQQVLPYYLHLLDRVAGTAHFEVSEARALELIQYLRMHLPGYLVPRLVREIPGEPCKTPVEQGC